MKWTDAERAKLLELVSAGASHAEVARQLGRTYAGVEKKLRELRVAAPVEIPVEWEAPHHEDPSPDLGISYERILFVPDTHAPYADEAAWALMLAAARKWRPHRVVVLGDLADFYAVSDHSHDPARKLNLKWEVGEVNKKLEDLDSLGATFKHFIEGNHEDRLRRHLAQHSPAMFDMFDIPGLFRLAERGWTHTPYGQAFKIGHLYATHDEGSCGVTAHIKARGTFTGNVAIGHTHHMGVDYLGNARGETHVGVAFGWLGDVASIDYKSRVKAKQWSHGFGIGHRFGDDVHLQACPIVNGRVVVDGVATLAKEAA